MLHRGDIPAVSWDIFMWLAGTSQYSHPGTGIASRDTHITLNCASISSGILMGKCRVKGCIVIQMCSVVPRTTGKMWTEEKEP